MQRLIAVLSLVGVMGFASAANAQFYVGAHGGVNFVQDGDLQLDGVGADFEASFDPGFAAGGVVGYRFDAQPNVTFDLEGEVAYRRNGIDEFEIVGIELDGDGDVSSIAGFVNGWINWRLSNSSNIVPYFGGGIGAVQVSVDDAEIGALALSDEDDLVFGGQVGAGVAYQFTENVEISLDYRSMITENPEFEDIEAEYQNHSVMVGLKFLF